MYMKSIIKKILKEEFRKPKIYNSILKDILTTFNRDTINEILVYMEGDSFPSGGYNTNSFNYYSITQDIAKNLIIPYLSEIYGIDIRETLRNWHTGSIYVKETPSSHKQVDTVVILFDSEHDESYPQRGTWYAEHEQESTLTFFSTNPFDKMIGPGIAQARYGGLSLLFPPRPVQDVFSAFPANSRPNKA